MDDLAPTTLVLIQDGIPDDELVAAIGTLIALNVDFTFEIKTRPATHLLVPSQRNAAVRQSFLRTFQALINLLPPIDIDTLSAPALAVGPSPTPSLSPPLVTPPPVTPSPIQAPTLIEPPTTPRTPTRKKAGAVSPYTRLPRHKGTLTKSSPAKASASKMTAKDPLLADLLAFTEVFDYSDRFGDDKAFKQAFWSHFIALYPQHASYTRDLALGTYYLQLEKANMHFCACYQKPRTQDDAVLEAFKAFLPTFPWEDRIITRNIVMNAFIASPYGQPFKITGSYRTHFFKRFKPMFIDQYPRLFDMNSITQEEAERLKTRGSRSAPQALTGSFSHPTSMGPTTESSPAYDPSYLLLPGATDPAIDPSRLVPCFDPAQLLPFSSFTPTHTASPSLTPGAVQAADGLEFVNFEGSETS